MFYIRVFLLIILSLQIHSSLSSEQERIRRFSKEYLTKTLSQSGVLFHIHYPREKVHFKKKVEEVIKSDLDFYHHYFKYKPQSDVHFLIVSAMEANGLAKVFPYNVIVLNDYPPVATNYLSNSEDWIKQLVIHEYIHILTMDMTKGFVQKLRYIFGSMVKTNAVIPRWLSEGVAVWAEGLSPEQGRANSQGVLFEVYHQLKNSSESSDSSNSISVSSLDYPRFYPFGHMRYWVGGLFVKFIEDKHPGAVSCIFNDHADGVPFFLDSIFENCIGTNVEKTFSDFRNSFLNENSNLENHCPRAFSVCQKLKQKNLLSFTDWQKGSCKNFVIIRKNSSSNPLSAAHMVYNVASERTILTDHPIDQLLEVSNQCLLSVFKNDAGQLYREFYLMEKDGDKLVRQKQLRDAEKVIERNGKLYPVHYQNGQWKHVNDREMINEDKIQSRDPIYSPWRYMTPTYWYFLFSNIANLNRLNLITSLSDPLERHRLSLQYDFFEHPEVPSQSGGTFFYNYQQDLYRWSLGYNKTYSLSLFNSNVNSSEFNFFSFQKILEGFENYHSVGVTLSNLQREDFISKRNSTQLELSYNLSYNTTEIKSFVRSMQLSTQLLQSRVEGQEDFYGISLGYSSKHYLSSELELKTTFSYGKYFKEDLTRGYLSGGGFSSFLTGSVTYPFFAVNQGDIFGNEMISTRLMFNQLFKDLFWSRSTTPIFLRNLNFNFGLEYAKSKYIAVGNRLYIDDSTQALLAGVSLDSVLFYGVPVEFSLLLANMVHPQQKTSLLLYFNASLF